MITYIYIYIYISMKPLWKVVQIVRYTWVWVAKDKSNTDCQSGSQQARVNGESNHDNVISAQCSECQSVEKTFAKDVVIDHERKSKGIEDINCHRLHTFKSHFWRKPCLLSCVHCQQWRKRKWSRSPSTTAAACAQMVLLVTKLRARSSL